MSKPFSQVQEDKSAIVKLLHYAAVKTCMDSNTVSELRRAYDGTVFFDVTTSDGYVYRVKMELQEQPL